ncbi:unnamed protein product, partial [Brassica oleracea]
KPRKIGPLPSLPLQWLSPAAPPPKLFGDCVSEPFGRCVVGLLL